MLNNSFEKDEIIFIDFRPRWLRAQLQVYKYLKRTLCNICYYEYYPECIAQQHDTRHPAVCKLCYSKLISCPFCREVIKDNLFSMIELYNATTQIFTTTL